MRRLLVPLTALVLILGSGVVGGGTAATAAPSPLKTYAKDTWRVTLA